MPRQLEVDGKTVTVYTEEEHAQLIGEATTKAKAEAEAAVATARDGLLTKEQADKLVNSAAAKARTEAQAKIEELTKQIQEAGGNAEKLGKLEKELAEATTGKAAAERKLLGITRLAGATKVPLAAAEQLVNLPMFADVDFADAGKVKAAVEQFVTLFPQYKPDPAPEGGEGGAGGGGGQQQTQTPSSPLSPGGGTGGGGAGDAPGDLSKMKMRDYIAARDQQGPIDRPPAGRTEPPKG